MGGYTRSNSRYAYIINIKSKINYNLPTIIHQRAKRKPTSGGVTCITTPLAISLQLKVTNKGGEHTVISIFAQHTHQWLMLIL